MNIVARNNCMQTFHQHCVMLYSYWRKCMSSTDCFKLLRFSCRNIIQQVSRMCGSSARVNKKQK